MRKFLLFWAAPMKRKTQVVMKATSMTISEMRLPENKFALIYLIA